VRLIRVLIFFVPSANPDFEALYPDIVVWYVEVDESGVVKRELALDSSGEPIMAGPWHQNRGFWTDSPERFPIEEASPIDRQTFEACWKTFQSRIS